MQALMTPPDTGPTTAAKKSPMARSAVVGLVASLADMLVLGLLVEVLHMPKAWANVPALSLGLLVQFVGNKYFAFNDRSRDVVRQGSLFLAIEVVAFALNAGLFHLLGVVVGWPWWLARGLASAAVYFGFSYPLWGR
ncbi:MAG: GtrA family protein, partial [Myxococcota bacterium]